MLSRMALEIRRLGPDDWQLWRDVRLAALADAPYAFGSTLAREREYDEDAWRSRLGRSSGVFAAAFVGDDPAGIIACWTPERTDTVNLVALWVTPAARGLGTADALVGEVVAWATEHRRPRVELHVADGNDRARRVFLRNGFVPTGKLEPLESNPAVNTEVLIRELSYGRKT
jgi:GNAT superfamily N-acetyltransferase